MTLNEVATNLGVTRQFVSRWENNLAAPNNEQVSALASILKVNKNFFCNLDAKKVEEHQFHFRKLRTTKVKTKENIIALGDIFRRLVEYIDHHLDLPPIDFPNIECSNAADIERAAEECRRYWGLGLGPIENMTRIAENKGAMVTDFMGASEEIDALSICASRPLIVRNAAKMSPGRLRFDLAHEVGHFVLHEGKITGDKKTESEANHFASAFLLPRSSFTNIFPVSSRINWSAVQEIKKTFKVSKAAILYRAKQLGLIPEKQYVGAVIRLKKHEGKFEKDDFLLEPMEQPEMLHNALSLLEKHLNISISDIEDELHLGRGTLSHVLGQNYSYPKLDFSDYGENVVPFKRIQNI